MTTHSLLLALCLAPLTCLATELPLTETFGQYLRHEPEIRQQIRHADADEQGRLLLQLAAGPNQQSLQLAMDLARDHAGPATMSRMLNAMAAKPQAVPLHARIAYLASSRDPEIRASALSTLASLKDYRAIDPLIMALKDSDQTVVAAAERGLQTVTGASLGRDRDAWHDWVAKRELALEKALPTLLRDLESRDVRTVSAAVHRLLQMEHHPGLVAELLEPLLVHDDPAIATLVQDALQLKDNPLAAYRLSRYSAEALQAARQPMNAQTDPDRADGRVAGSQAVAASLTAKRAASACWLVLAVLAMAGILVWWYRSSHRVSTETKNPGDATRCFQANQQRIRFTS
jgi:hypothetical protein